MPTLCVGFSAFLGGQKFKTLCFNRNIGTLNTSLMFLVVVSLVIPAVFSQAGGLEIQEAQNLSLFTAILLLVTAVAQACTIDRD